MTTISLEYLRGLGPEIPTEAQPGDQRTLSIHSIAVLTDLNPLGEAVIQAAVSWTGEDQQPLLIFVNPRALTVTRAVLLQTGGVARPMNVHQLPGILIDIAQTKVSEVFGPCRN
jgi:hypothetical protein